MTVPAGGDGLRPEDAGLAASDLDTARRRLRRMMLEELQTGGGLRLADAGGDGTEPAVSPRAPAVRRLAARLAAARVGEPERAADLLTTAGSPGRVLDIGAGRAPWTLALAGRDDGVGVTAVDLPEQLGPLAAAVTAAGRGARFELHGLDVLSDALPTGPGGDGYDLVLVANVCHLFEAGRTRLLLERAAAVVAPGGVLAVIDQVLDDDPDWLVWSVLYALGLPHVLPGGFLFTVDEYHRWLRGAGLAPQPAVALGAPPALTLVRGRRTR